jgi:hypothetical protein
MYLAGPGSTTCNFVEFLLWSGTALSAAQMVALDADQRNYWIPLPLDNFTAPAGAYSMRRLKSAYAGPAVKLRRTTGGISDIGFTAAGDFDTAAAQTFCAATTCFLDTWYDQSGNAWHASAGAVNQPAFVFNCIGTQPCARSSANNQFLQTVSVAWASAVSSFSAVGMRSAGAASCWLAQKGANNSFGFNNSANNWVVSDNIANFFPMAAADSVWHAGVGIIAAAASLGRIDATEIAGVNIPGTSAAATLNIIYSAGGDTCSTTEILVWDGYALTLPERQALVANQRAYWGF